MYSKYSMPTTKNQAEATDYQEAYQKTKHYFLTYRIFLKISIYYFKNVLHHISKFKNDQIRRR